MINLSPQKHKIHETLKARRHEMHTLETPEASKGRGAKEHVEFEPDRERVRYKHLRHVRQKARKTRGT